MVIFWPRGNYCPPSYGHVKRRGLRNQGRFKNSRVHTYLQTWTSTCNRVQRSIVHVLWKSMHIFRTGPSMWCGSGWGTWPWNAAMLHSYHIASHSSHSSDPDPPLIRSPVILLVITIKSQNLLQLSERKWFLGFLAEFRLQFLNFAYWHNGKNIRVAPER